MNLNDKIFVAGHQVMVGSAIVRRLQKGRYSNILTATKDENEVTLWGSGIAHRELMHVDDNVSKMESLGFRPKIALKQSITQMISKYRRLKQ